MVKVHLPPDREVSYGKINYYNKMRERSLINKGSGSNSLPTDYLSWIVGL